MDAVIEILARSESVKLLRANKNLPKVVRTKFSRRIDHKKGNDDEKVDHR